MKFKFFFISEATFFENIRHTKKIGEMNEMIAQRTKINSFIFNKLHQFTKKLKK